MEDRIIKLIATILEMDPDSITDELSVSSCPDWDSIATMSIISSLEKEFSIKFGFDDLLMLDNIGSIKKIVMEKSNANSC
jgi:acyl carrier protein